MAARAFCGVVSTGRGDGRCFCVGARKAGGGVICPAHTGALMKCARGALPVLGGSKSLYELDWHRCVCVSGSQLRLACVPEFSCSLPGLSRPLVLINPNEGVT